MLPSLLVRANTFGTYMPIYFAITVRVQVCDLKSIKSALDKEANVWLCVCCAYILKEAKRKSSAKGSMSERMFAHSVIIHNTVYHVHWYTYNLIG